MPARLPAGSVAAVPGPRAHHDSIGARMRPDLAKQHWDTIIIGGGQAGLALGFYLARRGREFVILDAQPRVGDNWR
ncbi:MAG: NAD(P)-binding protein, partial [Myxococcaceae bacterium]